MYLLIEDPKAGVHYYCILAAFSAGFWFAQGDVKQDSCQLSKITGCNSIQLEWDSDDKNNHIFTENPPCAFLDMILEMT